MGTREFPRCMFIFLPESRRNWRVEGWGQNSKHQGGGKNSALLSLTLPLLVLACLKSESGVGMTWENNNNNNNSKKPIPRHFNQQLYVLF